MYKYSYVTRGHHPVNPESHKSITLHTEKVHVATLAIILMILMVPKVNIRSS